MVNLYWYLIPYIVCLLAISYYVSRKQTSEDYFISGRNRKGWQIFASKFAGGIGAGYFITYTGFAYEYGLGIFAMLAGIIVGYSVFAYWAAPRIYNGSKEKKFYTIGDFVFDKTKSESARTLINIVSSGLLFVWLLTGIIGGGKIISDFGLMSYSLAVIVTSGVILAYLLLAGFRAVILTDVVQSIVIFLLLIVVTFSIVGTQDPLALLASSEGSVDITLAISFFLFGVLSVFAHADRYQLSYAAADERKLKHGLGLSVIPIVFAAFFLLFVGVFMANNSPGLDSGLVFTEALKYFLPASLLPYAIVLFFAGVMSSADTNIYAISSQYALSKKVKSIRTIRVTTIVLMIATTLLALLFPDVVDVSILAGGISLTIPFAMMYVLTNGKNPARFIGSVIGGLAGLVIGLALFGIEPTVAITALLCGVLGLLWKGRKITR